MVDQGTDEDIAHLTSLPMELVETLWGHFKGGATPACPKDAGPLALAVDGGAKLYRLVCTQCGVASPWFEATSQGIYARGPTPTLEPHAASDE